MRNRYKKVAHFSEAKFCQILKCFSHDLTATHTAKLTGVSRNTVNSLLTQKRQRILRLANQEAGGEKPPGTFECDDSYFGARRVRGKRGLGAAGKTPVLAIGTVFLQIVENCSKSQLLPVIQGKILEGSTINTDGWKALPSIAMTSTACTTLSTSSHAENPTSTV